MSLIIRYRCNICFLDIEIIEIVDDKIGNISKFEVSNAFLSIFSFYFELNYFKIDNKNIDSSKLKYNAYN